MPLFEYTCMACGCRFEKLHKAGAEYRTECPACGSAEVRKEMSTFAATGSSPAGGGCFSGG